MKDHYAAAETRLDQQGSMPELLRAILDRNPNVFSGTSGEYSQQQTVTHILMTNELIVGVLFHK